MAVGTTERDTAERNRTEAATLDLARQFLADVDAGAARHCPFTLGSALACTLRDAARGQLLSHGGGPDAAET